MQYVTEEKLEEYESALIDTESRQNVNLILDHIRESQEPDLTPSTENVLSHLTGVKLPKEGGILSYFAEHIYPRKGFPTDDVVEKVDTIKKTILGLIYTLSKSKVILAIAVLFFRKDLMIAYNELLLGLCNVIGTKSLKANRHCISVREVYNAFDLEDGRLRVITTAILEFDDAYRFRFQDVVGELDKKSFEKNPFAELSRLLELLSEREQDERVRGTWKKLQSVLFILFFSRFIREKVITFFSRLNPENVKMDEGDRYYANLKKDGYRWGGVIK